MQRHLFWKAQITHTFLLSQNTSKTKGCLALSIVWIYFLSYCFFAPTASSQGLGTVYGIVCSATTGAPVTGATVRLAGRTTTTNSQGKYMLRDIPATFRVGFTNDGRRTGTFPLSVSLLPTTISEGVVSLIECTSANFLRYQTTDLAIRSCGRTEHNINLSTDLQEGALRFVLTWGPTPYDLDIFFSVPPINNLPRIIVESNLRYFIHTVSIDRDIRTGYGPETLTIQRFFPGTYILNILNGGDCPKVS